VGQKHYENVDKSQSFLIMINPMICPRAPVHSGRTSRGGMAAAGDGDHGSSSLMRPRRRGSVTAATVAPRPPAAAAAAQARASVSPARQRRHDSGGCAHLWRQLQPPGLGSCMRRHGSCTTTRLPNAALLAPKRIHMPACVRSTAPAGSVSRLLTRRARNALGTATHSTRRKDSPPRAPGGRERLRRQPLDVTTAQTTGAGGACAGLHRPTATPSGHRSQRWPHARMPTIYRCVGRRCDRQHNIEL
jgi:hypothetical protein